MALCVIFAYTGFAFAGTEGEETTTPETGTEVTETVVEDEPVEGTEEPIVEETTEDTEEPVVEETPAPKAKKASKKAKSSLSLLAEGDDEPEYVFSPVNGIVMNHNVYVNNNENDCKTIYCLQEDYAWPDENAKYVKDSSFLSDAQIAVLQKILYAGYPYNAVGLFDDDYINKVKKELANDEDFKDYNEEEIYEYIMEDLTAATQFAIWEQLSIWNEADGSLPGAVSVRGKEGAGEAVYKLLEFAWNGVIPTRTNIKIEASADATSPEKLIMEDGKWKSAELKISDSESCPLTYSLTTTSGIKVVDKNGNTITSVKGNTPFYLVSESEEFEGEASVTAEVEVKYPTDVEQYRCINSSDYQTILSVGEGKMTLTDTFTATTESKDKDPEEKDPTNPDNPGGNTTPPAIGPTPTPSLPTVTPDGDGTDTPAIPEDPSDDEVDSDALGNGGAATVDDDGDDSIDGDPMGDPDAIDDEEDVDADALGVKTGDASDMIPWTVGFTAALLGLFVALKVRRREN